GGGAGTGHGGGREARRATQCRHRQDENCSHAGTLQIATTPVLSPKELAGTSSLCSMASSRFDSGVAGSTWMCRPPCSLPHAAPASRIGSGLWSCWLLLLIPLP